ncbi:MAG TPA: VOC family protein [Terriglobales bacterium]|jgi:catechol 2,3-dioxygenase-like lactoylglutathione lyase family enzyme
MSLLRPAGANYVGVRDLASAISWYTDKLGLHKVQIEMDDPEGCVALGFDKRDAALVLGPADRSSDELSPLMYASNLKKAREFLSGRGVNVGEIQKDRQNTHFFEMRDLEGNVIEVSEEP